MSSKKYATPLTLALRPSRWLGGVLLAAHGGALALLWLIDLHWAGQVVLSVLLAGSLWYGMQVHASRYAANAVVGLVWDADHEWLLVSVNGKRRYGRLLPGSYVTPYFVVLRFEIGEMLPVAVVLPADAAEAESLRRLRVRLRLEGYKSLSN